MSNLPASLPNSTGETRLSRAATVLTLILSGESIYTLPYFLRRDYSDSMLEAMSLTQSQLGWLSSIFGVFALLCYFPGGFLADRWSARKLMTASLLLTAGGGFYLTSFPPFPVLLVLFGFWGVTTILMFWAALIKATRHWGGPRKQGRAFGMLDGGRALFGAILGSAALSLFASQHTPVSGLRIVIVGYATVALATAVLVWIFVPEDQGGPSSDNLIAGMSTVLRLPVVWWHAAVVFCAYAGYWGTYYLQSYASNGFGFDSTESARVSVLATWFGPPAALFAGWSADRIRASRSVGWSFVVLGLAMTCLAAVSPNEESHWVLWFGATLSCAAAFALRGTYFALLKEGNIPPELTGTTVGVVSVIGFCPDILLPPIAGALIDRLPDGAGHRWIFGCLALLAVIGMASAAQIARGSKRCERQ